MGPFDRGILFLYSITLTLLFAALGAFEAGWSVPIERLLYQVSLPANQQILWVILVVYVLIGLRLLWKSLRSGGRQRQPRQVVVNEGGLGRVGVSIMAVEELAEKTALAVPGSKEVKARVVSSAQGIAIRLKLMIEPDISIPTTAEEIQNKIKESIYNVVGITVSEVEIAVESFKKAAKPRVE